MARYRPPQLRHVIPHYAFAQCGLHIEPVASALSSMAGVSRVRFALTLVFWREPAPSSPAVKRGNAPRVAAAARSACDLWVRYLPRSAFCAEMPGKHPALRILSRSCNRASRPDTTRLDFAILLHRG